MLTHQKCSGPVAKAITKMVNSKIKTKPVKNGEISQS